MQIIENIPVWGDPDQEVINQMKAVMSYESKGGHKARFCALMADHHLGYSVPVGGVVAYEGAICVNGVGYDIACGNKAVRLDCDSVALRSNIYRTMNEIHKHISFGIGRNNDEKVYHEIFDEDIWNQIPLLGTLKDKARNQLGTVGGGNHYVDVFIDELDRVWVGVHFGSRGLGHSIASHFVEKEGGKDGVHADPVIFGDDTQEGKEYLACMELAGRYAYAGRNWVCQRVSEILRGNIVEEVHNHHNFAWKERHFDTDVWVIRKGATPAFPGQKGFVGGSMGDISFIMQGKRYSDLSKLESLQLQSTIHGAGRAMGRSQAKGKRDKRGNITRPGLISQDEMQAWIKERGVEVRGGDVDEAPQAYKRIERVLEAHKETIDILHTLRPIGVCMAEARVYDPYKD